MALLIDNSLLFIHIPKCAGTWFRHVIKHFGIPSSEIGGQHAHFPELLQQRSHEFFRSIKTAAIIRHPLTWYQSRWAFRLKSGWKIQHPLDFHCASNNFKQFVANVIGKYPNGWITSEYSSYIDHIPSNNIEIVRMENLYESTSELLASIGHHIDVQALAKMPLINDSSLDGRPPCYWAKYNADLVKRIVAVESQIINRYYFDFEIDHSILYDQP